MKGRHDKNRRQGLTGSNKRILSLPVVDVDDLLAKYSETMKVIRFHYCLAKRGLNISLIFEKRLRLNANVKNKVVYRV